MGAVDRRCAVAYERFHVRGDRPWCGALAQTASIVHPEQVEHAVEHDVALERSKACLAAERMDVGQQVIPRIRIPGQASSVGTLIPE